MLTIQDNFTPVQHDGVRFIVEHPNCALWADMGVGKTIQTLTAFDQLLQTFEVRRMLVVGPLRVARKVWADEILEWAHTRHLTCSTIIGAPKQRLKALRTPSDIHCINKEMVSWLEDQFFTGTKQVLKWPWDLVVLDESQLFKSRSTVRWKSMRRLRSLIPRMVQLSGTMCPNGYEDLWAQVYLLDQGIRLGRTLTEYLERYFDAPFYEYGKWTLKPGAKEAIHKKIADIVLVIRDEKPPVPFNFVRVQMSPEQMKVFRKMQKSFITEMGDSVLSAVNAGVLDNKLLQLANGAVYTGVKEEGGKREWIEFHNEKIVALQELTESTSDKMVVPYYFLHDKARISAMLDKSGRTWKALKSDEDFGRFAAGEYEIGLLHPASAGHGLNDVYKSGAKHIVHFGCTANLEWVQQVNARLTGGHRRGEGVQVHFIVCDETRDDDYVDKIKGKADDQDGLKDSLRARVAAA